MMATPASRRAFLSAIACIVTAGGLVGYAVAPALGEPAADPLSNMTRDEERALLSHAFDIFPAVSLADQERFLAALREDGRRLDSPELMQMADIFDRHRQVPKVAP